MAKKMSKEDQEYLKQCESWFKTQDFAIKTCLVNIRHAREQISIHQEAIRLELKEMGLKQRTKKAVQAQVAQVKKRY